MAFLDPIFAAYPVDGFQDIWFRGLTASEAEGLFYFACHNQEAADIMDVHEAGAEERRFALEAGHEFKALTIDNVVLQGVAIRIEDDEVAIDFNTGLEYWNSARQDAFIEWLRSLHRRVPHARLDWAHEGCGSSPSEYETNLLRRALAGDA